MKRVIRKARSIITGDDSETLAGNLGFGGNSSIPPTHTDTPTDNPANNAPNSPHGLPKNILAFRTITTLLARIQQENPLAQTYTELDNLAVVDSDKETLRISTAFANLAVTKNSIVAVATHLSAKDLQVVVCANFDDDNEHLLNRTTSSKIDTGGFWRFLISANPRRDDPPSDIQHPTIVDTKIPSHVDPEDDKTLINYIKETW